MRFLLRRKQDATGNLLLNSTVHVQKLMFAYAGRGNQDMKAVTELYDNSDCQLSSGVQHAQ